MDKKIRISFVIPEKLQRELKERVIKDGYDLKGKSKWVSESVKELLLITHFEDLVKVSEEMNNLGKLEAVILDKQLKQEIDAAALKVRKKYPSIEGVQSRILRTAIIQRLLF